MEEVTITLKVALAPAHIGHPMKEVKNQLNGMLFKYSDELGGVPLCFSGMKFAPGKEYGRIMAELPWLHVDVSTKLLVFKPAVGHKLVGKITQVSDNNVSMLIYGMFNASISEAEMSKKYSYNDGTNAWESPTGDVSEGDALAFTISGVQHANGVLAIDGSLN